ncbi:hypothetical protein [Streptomyces wuyuanensis]|uniref:hypothetical protein n=1 Tax=Streptomyces wuyuanensis TaxID=1196353 RepID=UPI00370F98F6
MHYIDSQADVKTRRFVDFQSLLSAVMVGHTWLRKKSQTMNGIIMSRKTRRPVVTSIGASCVGLSLALSGVTTAVAMPQAPTATKAPAAVAQEPDSDFPEKHPVDETSNTEAAASSISESGETTTTTEGESGRTTKTTREDSGESSWEPTAPSDPPGGFVCLGGDPDACQTQDPPTTNPAQDPTSSGPCVPPANDPNWQPPQQCFGQLGGDPSKDPNAAK